MLLTPASLTEGLTGMDYLQAAMDYHLGTFGVIFIAIVLWLFSFSTFLGILYYACLLYTSKTATDTEKASQSFPICSAAE